MEQALAAPARGEAARQRPGPRATSAPAPATRPVDPIAAPSPSPGAALQRCACGGGCPACRAKAAGLPALPIHPADDVYEREADRVADTVMRGGRASALGATPALPSISRLQRCSCGGGGGTCPECAAKKNEEEMQRSASGPDAGGSVGVAPPIVHEVLRSPGAPLDAAARAFFEPRFGRGFGDVRVHTDARAAESARAVDAVAYTVGSNLVFGAGAYRPESAAGRRLLAHELTHVVQQGGGGAAVQRAGNPADYPPGLPCPMALSSPGPSFMHVLFANDSSALDAAAEASLAYFVSGWSSAGSPSVRLDGYASKPFTEAHNWRLSCARALAVRNRLEHPRGGAAGIPAASITLFAQGETDEFSTAGAGVGADRRVTLVLPPVPQPAPDVPAPAPQPEPSTRCGPDITDPLAATLANVRSTYGGWSPAARRTACETLTGATTFLMAWDITHLYLPCTGWLRRAPYRPACGRPAGSAVEDATACGNSVEVSGRCFLAGTVNYALFGQICKLCCDEFSMLCESRMLALISAYKALDAFDDAGPPRAWARAAYHGFPGHVPTVGNRAHCTTGCPVPYAGPSPFTWVWEPSQTRSGCP